MIKKANSINSNKLESVQFECLSHDDLVNLSRKMREDHKKRMDTIAMCIVCPLFGAFLALAVIFDGETFSVIKNIFS